MPVIMYKVLDPDRHKVENVCIFHKQKVHVFLAFLLKHLI